MYDGHVVHCIHIFLIKISVKFKISLNKVGDNTLVTRLLLKKEMTYLFSSAIVVLTDWFPFHLKPVTGNQQ